MCFVREQIYSDFTKDYKGYLVEKKKICDEILCQFLSDHGTIFFSLDLSVPWNLKLINIACHIIPN